MLASAPTPCAVATARSRRNAPMSSACAAPGRTRWRVGEREEAEPAVAVGIDVLQVCHPAAHRGAWFGERARTGRHPDPDVPLPHHPPAGDIPRGGVLGDVVQRLDVDGAAAPVGSLGPAHEDARRVGSRGRDALVVGIVRAGDPFGEPLLLDVPERGEIEGVARARVENRPERETVGTRGHGPSERGRLDRHRGRSVDEQALLRGTLADRAGDPANEVALRTTGSLPLIAVAITFAPGPRSEERTTRARGRSRPRRAPARTVDAMPSPARNRGGAAPRLRRHVGVVGEVERDLEVREVGVGRSARRARRARRAGAAPRCRLRPRRSPRRARGRATAGR